MKSKQIAVNGVAAIAIAASMATAAQEAGQQGDHLATMTGLVREAHEATQQFQNVSAAIVAGYVSTGSCASGPNGGAMGVHYVNEGFINDGVLDVRRPEILVYEPRNGQLILVAIEFMVMAQQWDAANAGPPILGGQLFHYVAAPNRLRMPAHYELHVWAWKRNPEGTFSDWNPDVSCVDYTGDMQGRGSGR